MIQLAKSSLGDWICLIQVDEMKNCYILSATTKKRYKTKKPWIKDFINQSIKNKTNQGKKSRLFRLIFLGKSFFFEIQSFLYSPLHTSHPHSPVTILTLLYIPFLCEKVKIFFVVDPIRIESWFDLLWWFYYPHTHTHTLAKNI